MLDRFLEALTGRRLGGALFVLLGLIVLIIVLWPGDDGGSDRSAKATIQPVRIVSVPDLGLAFAHPRTWPRSLSGSVIRLRSPDRAAVLTFASPIEGMQTRRVKDVLKQGLRKRFAPSRIVRDGPGRLGTRRATTFELQGFGPGNDAVRALVLVAGTPYRTYAVTLFTPTRPSAKRLAEVQQILATVRLTKPRPRKR